MQTFKFSTATTRIHCNRSLRKSAALSRRPRNTSQFAASTLSFSEFPVLKQLDVLCSSRLPSFASPLHPHRSSLISFYDGRELTAPNRLVLETLNPLPEDRKCFRMINGVLVERTVKDVIPALKTNGEGLKKVLDDLVKTYKAKQDELEVWKVCHA